MHDYLIDTLFGDGGLQSLMWVSVLRWTKVVEKVVFLVLVEDEV